jgi:hypothetical protein
MAANRVTEVFQSRGDPTNLEALLRGYISGAVGPSGSLLTEPDGFCVGDSEENLVWVVTPEYSTVRPLGPCRWNADHGATLPAQFAKCVVAIDNNNVPTVLWWEGERTALLPGKETITTAMLAPATVAAIEYSGALRATFGQVELKFVAAATAEVKVTHGLGRTPKYLFVSQDHQITAGTWPEYECPVSGASTTEFVVFARNVEAKVATAQVVLNWQAVG